MITESAFSLACRLILTTVEIVAKSAGYLRDAFRWVRRFIAVTIRNPQ
jgi:hypothetical protein